MHVNNLYCVNCVNFNLFRINIITKLFSFFAFIIFAVFNKYLIFTLGYTIILLFLFKISGFRLKILFRNLFEIWYLDIFVILFLFLIKDIFTAFMIFINFQIFFSYIFFLYYSTSSNELRKCFLSIFKPLKKIKVNIFKLSDFFVNIFNFFPEYNRYVRRIYKSEKNRGIDMVSISFFKKIRIIIFTYKKALSLYSKNYYKKIKMKEYLLFDENKKIKRIKSALGFRDSLFILIHILIIVFLFFQEEVYYEIFIKFFI